MTIFKRSSLAAVFAAWLTAGSNAFADGQLQFLWWQIGDPSSDLAGTLSSFSFEDEDGNSVSSDSTWVSQANAARVRVVETGGYLTTADQSLDTQRLDGYYPFPDDPFTIPNVALADITNFVPGSHDSPEYHFVVELGNWNEVNGDWTKVADSKDAITYDYIYNEGHLKTFNNGEPVAIGTQSWKPTTYVVPEPSGGLLVLLGAAGLLLRRRRKFRA